MATKQTTASASQKSEHATEDAFIGGVLQASTWAQQNRQLLTVLGIVLAILVAAGWYWISFQGNVEQQAVGELERIQQTVGLGDQDAARGELSTFLERFGGTASAGEARMLLGQLHLDAGDAAQAILVLEPAMSGLDEPVNLQSAMLLGAAYEAAQRPDDAITTYRRVAAEAALPFQSTEARLAMARLMDQQGDPAGAAQVYEALLADMEENAPNRALVEMRLAEVRARS